jgi:DNA-binding IclR family transcriptional regulator
MDSPICNCTSEFALRALLAFQDDETRQIRIKESLGRRPEQADP